MRAAGLVGGLLVLGLSRLAAGQDVPVASPSNIPHDVIEVRIGAVLASNSSKDFDPRLVSMRQQFTVLFPYSSYRLVKEARQRVPWGGRVGLDIPGGRYLLVVPKEYKNDRVSMKVMLIEGARPIVDTELSLKDRATLLVGGPRDPDGVLILSIGAYRIE